MRIHISFVSLVMAMGVSVVQGMDTAENSFEATTTTTTTKAIEFESKADSIQTGVQEVESQSKIQNTNNNEKRGCCGSKMGKKKEQSQGTVLKTVVKKPIPLEQKMEQTEPSKVEPCCNKQNKRHLQNEEKTPLSSTWITEMDKRSLHDSTEMPISTIAHQ